MKYITGALFFCMLLASAYSQDNWTTLDTELIVKDPPFEACHASSLVELASGELMVAFFAGSGEGAKDVCIWLARTKDQSWEKPYVIADGVVNDSLRYPCWNPVLFKTREGKLFLFYKAGPNPRQWWGMVKTSFDNGKTWSGAERLPDGILGPIKNKPIQLEDGTILSPSSVETENSWKVHIEKSSDSGKTWSKVPVDSASTFKVIQPSILQYSHNRLQLVCRSDQDRIVHSWSSDNGTTWTGLSKLALPNPNSGIDASTLKGGMQLLVYNPTTRGKEWFNNRGKLHVAVSADGIRWRDVAILEKGSKEEYSYPAVIQTDDGKVHITYTYDRKNIKHVVLLQKR